MTKDLHRAVYSAVFFKPHHILGLWRDTLATAVDGMPRIPDDGTLHCNHMTIQFRPDSDHVSKLPLGGTTELQVTGFAADSKCVALAVKYLRYGVESSNSVPHVTLWTSEGTPPVYSNELLEKGLIPIQDGPTIWGTTGFLSNLREIRYTYEDSIYGQEMYPDGI